MLRCVITDVQVSVVCADGVFIVGNCTKQFKIAYCQCMLHCVSTDVQLSVVCADGVSIVGSCATQFTIAYR